MNDYFCRRIQKIHLYLDDIKTDMGLHFNFPAFSKISMYYILVCAFILFPGKSFAGQNSGGKWEIRVVVTPGGMHGALSGGNVSNAINITGGNGSGGMTDFVGSHPFGGPLTVETGGKFSLNFESSAFAMHDLTLPYLETPAYAEASVGGTFKVFFIWLPENGNLSEDPPPSEVIFRTENEWGAKPPKGNGTAEWGANNWIPAGYVLKGGASVTNSVQLGDITGTWTKFVVIPGQPGEVESGSPNGANLWGGTGSVHVNPTTGIGVYELNFGLSTVANAFVYLDSVTGPTSLFNNCGTLFDGVFSDSFSVPAPYAYAVAYGRAIMRIGFQIEGKDNGKGAANYTGKGSDPSYTRWVPLAFSPNLNSQPFRIQQGALPKPWGNIDCLYSIRQRQENNADNPGQIIKYWHPDVNGSAISSSGAWTVVYDANGDRLCWLFGSIPEPGVKSELVGTELRHAGPPGAMRQRGNYTYKFSSEGNLLWFKDDHGNQQTLTWVPNGNLYVSDSSSGRSLLFERFPGGYFYRVTAQGILPTITYLDFDGGGHLTRLIVAYPNGTYDRDDSWAYGGPNGDSIITEFVGGLTRTNTWISAPYKDYNAMVTPRLSSFTLGDTNDTSSADQGVAGIYQVNLGTATLGYGSFGVRSRTFSITDPLGATWKEILGAGTNWLDNSYHETILRSRHVEGPDYTGAPLNSNHSTMVFLPEMRDPTEITLTDAFDMVWKAFFNSFGNVTKTRNPFGQEWEFTYSTDGKNLTQVKDPTNITTNYNYGQFGYLPSRLTSILDHANVEQLRLGWNSFGQLEQLTTLPTTAASGFEETTTLEYFNTTGDLKSVIDPLGGRIDIINVDGLGDPVMLGLYPLTGSSVTEPHPLVTSLEWTAAQDVKSVLFPNGLKLEHTINPKGQRTKSQVKNSSGALLGQFDFEYDTRGRLHHAYDSIGDLFKIKFDTAGNLTRSIDGNDHATVLTYGLAGDVSGITTPTGRQASFTYDRDGSPKSITDARQITTNFGYDFAGRPEVTWITGQPNEMVVNHYDNAGRLTLVNTPTGKSVAFAYNHANKWLTSVITTMPLGGVYSRVHTVSYTYYPDGKRQTMSTQATGVAATTTSYTYDKNGRMKTLTAPGGAVTSWNYDFIGRPLSQITLYSGGGSAGTVWEYGVSGQAGDYSQAPTYLRKLKHLVNGSVVREYTLTHNVLGQLLNVGELGSTTSATHSYDYDSRGRITGETETRGGSINYSGSRSYTYDAADNLNASGNGWLYDADNLLLSAPAAGGLPGLSPIVHDAPSGKVLRAGDKAFTYDAWGRIKTVSLVSGSGGGGGECPPPGPPGSGGSNTLLVSYEYDALGRRFSATSANDVRYFDYDGSELLGEHQIITGSPEPNPEFQPNPEELLAACLDGSLDFEEAAALLNTIQSGSYRQYIRGATGLIGSAGASINGYLHDALGNTASVTQDTGSGSSQQVWEASSGSDSLGNPMDPASSGGGANAPPYGISPFPGQRDYKDPVTGSISDADDGLSGVYDPSVGGDEEDDFLGENGSNGLYGGLLSAIHTGAGAAKEALATAADLHPASGFTGFVTGKDSRGCNLSAAARALDGFSMVPGGAMLGGATKGAKALARGGKFSKKFLKSVPDMRYMLGRPVKPLEKTLDHALNPQSYLDDIARKYNVNLRGSGNKIEIVFDETLGRGTGRLGVTKEIEGGFIIRVGPDAMVDEATAANTIAHELSHARDYLRGAGRNAPNLHKNHGNSGSIGDRTPYGSGNAIEKFIRGLK